MILRNYTDGEINYLSENIDDGFFYRCQHGDDELHFFICLYPRDESYEIRPAKHWFTKFNLAMVNTVVNKTAEEIRNTIVRFKHTWNN